MKDLPSTKTYNSTNELSINIEPSEFKLLEISQTLGSETTISISPQNGISFSHRTGDRTILKGIN